MALRPGLPDRRELWLLWGGMLAGPLAWLAELEASYALTGWACRTGKHWVLHATTVLALMLAIAGLLAAVVARRRFRSRRAGEPGTVGERRGFLIASGIGLSMLFALAILATTVPKVVLSPCML